MLGACVDFQESLIHFHDILKIDEILDGPLALSIQALIELEDNHLVDISFEWLYDKALQFSVAYVFTDPQKIKKFIRESRDEFSPEDLKAATHWSEHPFKWIFYSLVEDHGNKLFTILDELTQTRYLLYSPAVTDILTKNRNRSFRFLSLLFDSIACQQVLGPTFATEFTKEEMEFFCETLDASAFKTGGLTKVVKDHFVDFCRMEVFTPPSEESTSLQLGTTFLWKKLHLPGINTSKLPGEWTISTTTHLGQTIDRCLFLNMDPRILEHSSVSTSFLRGRTPAEFLTGLGAGAGAGMAAGVGVGAGAETEVEASPLVLYINQTTEIVGINSLSLSGFEFLLYLLSVACERPDLVSAQPDHALSASFVQTLAEIPEFPCPWDAFFNAFFDAFNRGTSTNPSETAAPIRKFTPLDNDIPPRLELSTEDQAFNFGLVQAASFSLETFDQPIDECELYVTHDDKDSYHLFDTLTNGSYSSEVQEGGLSQYFADLFEEEFGPVHSLQLMHMFNVMLLLSEEKKTLVRVHALEILRAYHHTILTKLETDIEGFIELFSRFVYRKLVKRGFVSVESRPSKDQLTRAMYTITPSEFCLHFIEPNIPEQETGDDFGTEEFNIDDFSEEDFDIDDSDVDDISDADFVVDEEDLS
jgi:hypothetical protein